MKLRAILFAFLCVLFGAAANAQQGPGYAPAGPRPTIGACPAIGSGTFANRPTSAATCAHYFATDLGTGVDLTWNGTNWKPATGVATIGESGAAAPASPLTGTASETNFVSFAVPGGMLQANDSIRVTTVWTVSNSANTKTVVVRYSSASCTPGTACNSGTTYLSAGFSTSVTVRTQAQILAANSTSAQIGMGNATSGFGASGNSADSSAINTANQSFININCQLANTGDTCQSLGYLIEWVSP